MTQSSGKLPPAEESTSGPLPLPPTDVRRIVYLGTPQVAVPPLQALHAAGFDIALVISAPDRRRGRGSGHSPSPVKAAALELGIPVSESITDAMGVEADLGVVVAFGQLIRLDVLSVLPMINLHFSLLPRWRGAAPVERALLAGDSETGICVMAVEEGLDTGGIYRTKVVPISSTATLEGLRSELIDQGSSLLVQSLQEGLGTAAPQEGEALYAKKIQAAELHLDWTLDAAQLDRQIRLGRAWTEFRGKRLRIWEANIDNEGSSLDPGHIDGLRVGAGSDALNLVMVQPEGKPKMAAQDWRNGAQPTANDRLQ